MVLKKNIYLFINNHTGVLKKDNKSSTFSFFF